MSHRVGKQFSAFSWLCFCFCGCFFVIITVDVAVPVRVTGVTVFVSRIILIIFSLFPLFVQQAALISVMFWFFTVVPRWFGYVGISICGLLGHSVYL